MAATRRHPGLKRASAMGREEIDAILAEGAQLRSRVPEMARGLAVMAVERAEAIGYARGVARGLLTLAWVELMERATQRATATAERARAMLRELGDVEGESSALNVLGSLARLGGELERSAAHHAEALELARRAGSMREEVIALHAMAGTLARGGRTERALELAREAERIATERGGAEEQGNALVAVAASLCELGRFAEAIAPLERALAIGRAAGHRMIEISATGNLAVARETLGDSRRALELNLACRALLEETGDRLGMATLLHNIGGIYSHLGDYPRAYSAYLQSIEINRQLGNAAGEGNTLAHLGMLYTAVGNRARALDAFMRAGTLAVEGGNPRHEARATLLLGSVYQDLGDRSRALRHYLKALRLLERAGAIAMAAEAERVIGELYTEAGLLDEAETFLRTGLERTCQVGAAAEEIHALLAIGALHRRRGDRDAAIATLESAAERARGVGHGALLAESIETLVELAREAGDAGRLARYVAEREECAARTFLLDGARRVREMIARFDGVEIDRDLRRGELGEEDLARVARIAALPAEAPGGDSGAAGPDAARTSAAIARAESSVEAPSPRAPRIRVTTLGALRLVVEGREITGKDWGRKRARELFKLLLVHHRRPVSVEQMEEMLWSDAPGRKVETLVMNAASHLRKALAGAAGTSATLRAESGAYILDLGPDAEVDFIRFKELMVAARRAPSAGERGRLYAEAVALYGGDFLPEDRFREWSDHERHVLRDAFLEGMEFLAREHLAHERYSAALDAARRIIEQDPTSEAAWETTLRALMGLGRAGDARRAIDECAEAFRRELDQEPPDALRALHSA